MKIVMTGVSRGLGHAMVEPFIELGHEIHGCARSAEFVKQWGDRFGAPHSFRSLDITDSAGVNRWADEILGTAGPPDLLINNAALINKNATLWTVTTEEFDRVVDTNVKGMFYVIRALVPAMIEAQHGVIVNFSSTWGRSVSPEVAPYCATKWAVEGLTQSLARELPGSLAAVPLNPGIINTEMLRSCFGTSAHAFPSPQDWASSAVPYILQLSRKDNGKPREVPQSSRR